MNLNTTSLSTLNTRGRPLLLLFRNHNLLLPRFSHVLCSARILRNFPSPARSHPFRNQSHIPRFLANLSRAHTFQSIFRFLFAHRRILLPLLLLLSLLSFSKQGAPVHLALLSKGCRTIDVPSHHLIKGPSHHLIRGSHRVSLCIQKDTVLNVLLS